VDSLSSAWLRWSLFVASCAAGACVLLMTPTVWALVSGQARLGYALEFKLPGPWWLRWSQLTQIGFGVLVAGALCALLLVAGGNLARVLALVSVPWVIYMKAAFSGGNGNWSDWIAATGDLTPYTVCVTIGVAVYAALAVAGFLAWRRLGHDQAGSPAELGLRADGVR